MSEMGPSATLGVQQIIDSLPAIVFEYTIYNNGSREFTYISPRCEELLGVGQEVLLRGIFPMKHFIHQEDWETFRQSSEASIASLNNWKWEGRIHARSGQQVWIEASGVPRQLDNGNVVWSGLISNITSRKILEQRQRETEERYRDLIEYLPLGVAIHAAGKLVFVNEAAAKMIGAARPEDLIGRDVFDFVHPDSREAALERVKLLLGGRPVPPQEEKLVTLSGKIVTVETAAHAYTYQGIPAVQLIMKDITGQKEATIAIKKTEKLFFQLFQNSPLAIVMLDEHGAVVQVNKGFEELFGYTWRELAGKGLNQFIVPEELEAEGNDLNSLISSDQVIRLESFRFRKDRSKVSVIIYGVPVRFEDHTIGIFGVYVDITERKRVEEELKIRNAELDNFVYKVSHDLRAPLSSVLGLVNLAAMPGNDDNLAQYFSLVGKKVEQLDHFISDVLSHSKNLKMEVKIAKINFHEIIEKTFSDLNYLKGVEKIRKEIVVQAGEFYSDPWRISEVFRNLISNAVKYRRMNIEVPAIHVLVRTNADFAEILFKDNGIGIDSKSLAHVFDMFYRASEQSAGSGLGLYIVKNAIEKLGGEISVDSTPGVGTTFKIKLKNQKPA